MFSGSPALSPVDASSAPPPSCDIQVSQTLPRVFLGVKITPTSEPQPYAYNVLAQNTLPNFLCGVRSLSLLSPHLRAMLPHPCTATATTTTLRPKLS